MEIPPSEFCPISRDWGELWIPYLARMSQIKFYGTLQNSRFTAFTVSELLRENQWGGDKLTPPLPTQIRVKGTLLSLRQFLVTERPLEMVKNAFSFISKALFVLKIFKFLSWLFGQNGFIRKIRLISKFMTS